MAKPDTDDGWYKLSHELDAALAVADFRKEERIILREVFSQVFGKAKLKSATLSPKAISQRCGIVPPNVSRAITALVSGSVLTRLKDGSYRFLKDYEAWTYKGSPRLSQEEIAYAKNAVKTTLSFCSTTPVEIVSNEITDKTSNSIQRDTIENERVSNGIIDRISLDNGIVSNETIDVAAPLEPPHGNAHAEFKTYETYETNSRACENGKLTVYPKSETKPHQTTNPPHEIELVSALATRLFPADDVGIKVRQLEANLNMATLEAALLDARKAGKSDWRYIQGIYDRRVKDGRGSKITDPDIRSVLRKKSVSTRPKLMSDEFRAELDAIDAKRAEQRRASS